MKELLFSLGLAAVSAAIVSCDDDKIVNQSDMPAQSQAFVSTHFPSQTIVRIVKDNDSYDVFLNNGYEIDFYLNGDWDEIECLFDEIPASVKELIPAAIAAYVSENCPQQKMVGVNKERYGYEIGLNNGVDLEFDSTGNFLRVDY